jgi:hypothetical protein
MKRSVWQDEADRRWPDAQDMVEPAIGDGQWATVSWCGPLLVVLHPTFERAVIALDMIKGSGCGHSCWRDHELVDLMKPERLDRDLEFRRGQKRATHAQRCGACRYFSSVMPGAAVLRANARRKDAA